MHQVPETQFDPKAGAMIAAEIIRGEIARMSIEVADDAVDIDDRIDDLSDALREIRAGLRARDYDMVHPFLAAACARLAVPVPTEIDDEYARDLLSTLKELTRIEIDVFEDGESPVKAGMSLLQRYGIRMSQGKVPALLHLSDVVAEAVKGQTKEMRRKLETTAELVQEFAGDIPIVRLPFLIEDLMLWISRLPKTHGKTAGANGRGDMIVERVLKADEIREADETDAKVYAEAAARTDLSDAAKKAAIVEKLTKRVTHTNLERHLDRLHQLMRVAEDLGYTGKTRLITYTKLAQVMTDFTLQQRETNPLFLRVTQPKLRLRWNNRRLTTLLTSPVYRGCSTDKRRANPGRMIFRDAIYWVPLILMTMGTRVTEVLQLKGSDLILRDGVLCLSLNWTAEQEGKTVTAQRIVPIPQILLDLGFVEWIHSKCKNPSDLLFPEVHNGDPDKAADILSKRLLTVRQRLGIYDYNEDLYALRKTLSSALWRAGVPQEDRQMIIGHISDTTIGRHYTDADMQTLKALLDQAEHGIVVEYSEKHRFPVVSKCTLSSGVPARAEVLLDEHGNLGAVRIIREDTGAQIVAAAVSNCDLPKLPDWDGMLVKRRALVAEAVADVLGDYDVAPHSNEAVQRAYEHLLALAAKTSDTRVSVAKTDSDVVARPLACVTG